MFEASLQRRVDRLCGYMTTNMVLNTDKGITIKQGVGCVIEMNKNFPYLPCLKQKECSPASMTAINTEFTSLELCTIDLNVVHLCNLTAYYDYASV